MTYDPYAPNFAAAQTPQQIGAATGQGTLTPTYGASGQVTGSSYAPTGSAPLTTQQQMSIGLYNGTIQNQADVNKLYGNESYGSAVPEANAQTARYTQSAGGYAAPAQASAYSAPAPAPTSASARAGSTSASQGDVSGAGMTSSGGAYSRYTAGMSDEEKRLQDYIETPEKPKTEAELVAEKTQSAQGLVNSINENYNNTLLDQSRLNDQRNAETNAQSVLSGLTGSTEAGQRAFQTTALNNQDNKKIQDQRTLALATLYNQIKNDAATEARQQKMDYRSNAKDALSSMSARREANNKKMMERLTLLGKNGVTLEGLKKTSDPETYSQMLIAAGGEEELKYTLFNAHSATAVGQPTRIGDFMAQTYQNADGTTKTEYVKLPSDVLASDPELFKNINTDNGTFISTDGGKTWKPLAGSSKPTDGTVGVSTGGYVLGSNKTVDSYANQISLGGLKMSDVPKALKPLVAQALDAITGGRLPPLISNLNESLKLVQELKTHGGREAATGAPSIFTNPFGFSLPASDARGFKGKVDRLNSLLFLNAIPQMRGMGQLTEREGTKLESSSSVTKNLGQPEAEYAAELDKLEKDLTQSIENLGGNTVGQEFANANMGEQVVVAPDGAQVIITD